MPDPVGDRQHRDDQRLVVGGDARIRQRGDIDRSGPVVGHHVNAVVGRIETEPHVAEPVEQHRHVVGAGTDDVEFTTGDGAGRQIGGGLDPVGHGAVRDGPQLMLLARPRSRASMTRSRRSGPPSPRGTRRDR